MNIRQAILKAADHIEKNPYLFRYSEISVPDDCGTPGCALGWIGCFMGGNYYEDDRGQKICFPSVSAVARKDLGLLAPAFYERMINLAPGWTCSAEECARGLRLYADKYHPAESHALIPASVRAVFMMTPEQIRAKFQHESA